jgi:hypothetical protein
LWAKSLLFIPFFEQKESKETKRPSSWTFFRRRLLPLFATSRSTALWAARIPPADQIAPGDALAAILTHETTRTIVRHRYCRRAGRVKIAFDVSERNHE